jgi:hypothetical protein
MTKCLRCVFLCLLVTDLQAQGILQYKRAKKTKASFTKGSIISFMADQGYWRKGRISRLKSDSLFILPLVIRPQFTGPDSTYWDEEGYAFTDIFAMPKNGILIDFIDGRFTVNGYGGHVHWYWIKSGYLFRLAALTFAGVYLANGLIQNDLALESSLAPLGIAAGLYAVGFTMKKLYHPYNKIGKKYHFVYVPSS